MNYQTNYQTPQPLPTSADGGVRSSSVACIGFGDAAQPKIGNGEKAANSEN